MSLADCLKKFGKAIDSGDAADIQARSMDLQAQGIDPVAAENQAVEEFILGAEAALQDIASRAEQAGSEVRYEQRRPEISQSAQGGAVSLAGEPKPAWLGVPDVTAATPRFTGKERRPEAVTAVGVHYGKVPGLSEIDPAMAGTGSAGRERRRFGTGQYGKYGGTAARSYFYVQQNTGQMPVSESVVSGTTAYRVVLDNLYDLQEDPLGLVDQAGVNVDLMEELISKAGFDGFNVDLMEELISKAGFDGFLAPPVGGGIDEPTAVVFDLGGKKIPVEDLTNESLHRS